MASDRVKALAEAMDRVVARLDAEIASRPAECERNLILSFGQAYMRCQVHGPDAPCTVDDED